MQITAVIAVAASIVTDVVVDRLDCDWEVAVMVTTLFVGTVAGAVYKPLVVSIEPLPVPLTDQLTRVLLTLSTLAVHCAVPSTVTSAPVPPVDTHEAVMDGVTAVEPDPQELRIVNAAISPDNTRRRSQRTVSHPKRKFRSNTRNPPSRTTLFSVEYAVPNPILIIPADFSVHCRS